MTSNAPLSGAVARRAEASAPRAGWASAGAFLLLLLTSNARLRGAVARSAEASLPAAG